MYWYSIISVYILMYARMLGLLFGRVLFSSTLQPFNGDPDPLIAVGGGVPLPLLVR